jgi:Flp pilus assembly protein TadG
MAPANATRRPGTAAVETAVVLSVLLLLVCGVIVGGIGVFRAQQVTLLACEGARYASVRGGDYQNDTGGSSPTQQQIINQAVSPMAVCMNPSDVSVTVEWINNATNTALAWDAAPKDVRSVTATGQYISNTVRVTVTYQWAPGFFWNTMTLQAVCELPMSN